MNVAARTRTKLVTAKPPAVVLRLVPVSLARRAQLAARPQRRAPASRSIPLVNGWDEV